jgi:O-antigen/teichoic acid export membrane protein
VLESLILTRLKSVFLTFIKNVLLRILNTVIVLLYFYDYIDQQELVLSFVLTYGIQFILLIIYFLWITKYRIENPQVVVKSDSFKSILSYILLIFLGGSGATIVAQIDSIISSYKLGLAYTGIYSIAFFIAVVIEIPRRNIIQIVSPLLTKAFMNNDQKEIKNIYQKTALNQFIASALVFLLIAFNLSEIYSFIPKNENFALIQQGMPVVLIVGISFVFDMLMGCNAEIIHFSKFYFWNAILIPILAISAIGFNLYFIEIMDNGLLAIAYATLVTFFIHNCIRCGIIYYYFKILPFNFGHLKLLGVLAITVGILFLVPTIDNVYISIGIKTILIVVLVAVGIIWAKVSEEVLGVYQKIKFRLFKA